MTGKKAKPSGATHDRFGKLAEASRRLDEARSPEHIRSAAKSLLAALGDTATLVGDVEQIGRDADAEMRRAFLSFEADLRAACARRGWSLDGVWPAFFIEKAVEIAIDEAGGSVRVAGQRFSMDVDAIADGAAPIVRHLLPRTFSPGGFLQLIASALEVVAAPGGSATIGQIYRQLVIDAQSSRFWRDAKSELFTPLSLDQFRARISNMLESNSRLPDGRVLRLSPPLNANDGVFLWQPAEHRFGYVGRMQLVHEAHP
ncbi:MAG: hypothetical protein E7812_02210 [Phenylobacterium sp.]|nr:MAG: hypothetical protein E7812_02210 [Phenylobacterium sp.]